MEGIELLIQSHMTLAPYLIFVLLLIAGANVPISEDLLNIAAASLAAAHPEMTLQLASAVLLGAYAGDQVSYWFGRVIEPVIENRFYRRSQYSPSRERHYIRYHRRRSWIKDHSQRHPALLLIVGRYLPFGFRNILHMSVGFVRIPYITYLLYDILGVALTTGLLFFTVHHYGSTATSVLGVFKYSVIIFVVLGTFGYIIWQKAMKSQE